MSLLNLNVSHQKANMVTKWFVTPIEGVLPALYKPSWVSVHTFTYVRQGGVSHALNVTPV